MVVLHKLVHIKTLQLPVSHLTEEIVATEVIAAMLAPVSNPMVASLQSAHSKVIEGIMFGKFTKKSIHPPSVFMCMQYISKKIGATWRMNSVMPHATCHLVRTTLGPWPDDR